MGREQAAGALARGTGRGAAGEPVGGAGEGERARPLPLALDPVEEGFLDGLARLAQRDLVVRNRLYERFRPFCEAVARRVAARRWVRLCEPEDVLQEGFLVFAGLVEGWRGEGRFAGYVFAHFEPRLVRAVRRLEGARPPGPPGRPPHRASTGRRRADERAAGELGAVELRAGLDPFERALVERLAAGERLQQVAARLGVTPRTVRRRLARLRARLAAV